MFHSFRDTSLGIKTDKAAGRAGNGGARVLGAAGAQGTPDVKRLVS
jgi:hypothetical protein